MFRHMPSHLYGGRFATHMCFTGHINKFKIDMNTCGVRVDANMNELHHVSSYVCCALCLSMRMLCMLCSVHVFNLDVHLPLSLTGYLGWHQLVRYGTC